METHRPFGLVTEAFGIQGARPDPAHATITEVLSGTGRLPSGDWAAAEFRLVELFLTLLDETSSSGPVMVVVEDLHWADVASLVVLSRIATTADRPVAVVMTVRPQPRRAELAAFLGSGIPDDAVRLRLGALAEAEGHRLAESLVGGPLGPRLRENVAGAGGNPLFIREIVSAFVAEGLISPAPDGARELDFTGTSPSFSVALFSHLHTLRRPTMELLGVASVLGSTFSLRTLSQITGRSVADLWSDLVDALGLGVLVEDGDRLAFRHALIHDSFYRDLPIPVRAALHGDAARVLGEAGAGGGIVAEHLIRSDSPGSAETRSGLHQAAVEVAATAPAVAVELFEAALATVDAGDPVAVEINAQLALALAASGRHLQAEPLARRLVGDDRVGQWEAALRAVLIQSLVVQGRLAESFTEVEAATGSESLTTRERARFAARRPMARLFLADWDGTLQAAVEAEAQAVAAEDAPAQVLALGLQATVASITGRWLEAAPKLARAVALTEADGTRAAYECLAQQTRAYVLADTDELEQALALSRSAQRSSEALGIAEGLVFAHLASGYVLFLSGDWEDALTAHDVSIALSEEIGMAWQVDTFALLAAITAWRGELATAWSWLERAQAEKDAGGHTPRIGWLGWARSVLEEAAGRTEQAVATLLPAWEVCLAFGVRADYRVLGPQLARLTAATGRFDLAAGVADHLDALLADNPSVTSLQAASTQARGLADQDGDALLEAVALYHHAGRPHDRARCAEEAAGVLARAGRLAEARAAAEEAFDLYATLGADGETARARSVLRQAGLRFGARGRRQRPVSGWAALTDTEQRIAGMVAERMTNPQIGEAMFLSRRTVGSHVSHLLAKLGMSSRTELIAAGARGSLEQL